MGNLSVRAQEPARALDRWGMSFFFRAVGSLYKRQEKTRAFKKSWTIENEDKKSAKNGKRLRNHNK